jgi:hypothetical protein
VSRKPSRFQYTIPWYGILRQQLCATTHYPATSRLSRRRRMKNHGRTGSGDSRPVFVGERETPSRAGGDGLDVRHPGRRVAGALPGDSDPIGV